MHRISLAAIAALLAVVTPALAMSDLVVRESPRGVKQTIDALAAAVEAKGIRIVARVDHAAGAKAAGMELRPAELLIFGNPKVGTPLIEANPELGVDLPMRVLAWQAADGKVYIGYTSPEALKARHRIKDRDAAIAAMAAALQGLVDAAVK